MCHSRGLSIPDTRCPAGYYCEAGTKTMNPDEITQNKPKACPEGFFCLGGVAHNKSLEWLPSNDEGQMSPKKCIEGYYCESSSSTPFGSGPCKLYGLLRELIIYTRPQ